MANSWAGEVEITLNGQPCVMKLTLGALVELETRLQAESLFDLAARLENGGTRAEDLVHLLHVGLKAGGWQGTFDDLWASEVEGGISTALQAAAQMFLAGFFAPGGGH